MKTKKSWNFDFGKTNFGFRFWDLFFQTFRDFFRFWNFCFQHFRHFSDFQIFFKFQGFFRISEFQIFSKSFYIFRFFWNFQIFRFFIPSEISDFSAKYIKNIGNMYKIDDIRLCILRVSYDKYLRRYERLKTMQILLLISFKRVREFWDFSWFCSFRLLYLDIARITY